MKNEDRYITYAPDEEGGAVAEAPPEDWSPEDREAAWKEINDQKADIGRAKAEAERARDEQIDRLARIAESRTPAQEETPPPPERSKALDDKLSQLENLDIVGDEQAAKKLAGDLREAFDSLRQDQQAQLKQLERSLEGRLTARERTDQIEKRNDLMRGTTISDLEEQFGIELSKDEKERVVRISKQKIGQDYGKMDRSGNWIYDKKSVVDAFRSEMFDKIQTVNSAKSRNDGLQARLRGEEASRSTGRSRRQARTGDEAFYQRYENTNRELEAGAINEAEAAARFTPDELRRITTERRGSRDTHSGRR